MDCEGLYNEIADCIRSRLDVYGAQFSVADPDSRDYAWLDGAICMLHEMKAIIEDHEEAE